MFTADEALKVVALSKVKPDAPPPLRDVTVHAFNPVRTSAALAYWASVTAVFVTVTPAPAAKVTTPAPRFVMLSVVPVGQTTEACGGIV